MLYAIHRYGYARTGKPAYAIVRISSRDPARIAKWLPTLEQAEAWIAARCYRRYRDADIGVS